MFLVFYTHVYKFFSFRIGQWVVVMVLLLLIAPFWPGSTFPDIDLVLMEKPKRRWYMPDHKWNWPRGKNVELRWLIIIENFRKGTIPVEEALIDANFLKKNSESRKLLSTTIMRTIIIFSPQKCLKI